MGKYGGKVREKVTWLPVTSFPVMRNGQILHMDPPQMLTELYPYTTLASLHFQRKYISQTTNTW
jgi:hypothetical protein